MRYLTDKPKVPNELLIVIIGIIMIFSLRYQNISKSMMELSKINISRQYENINLISLHKNQKQFSALPIYSVIDVINM